MQDKTVYSTGPGGEQAGPSSGKSKQAEPVRISFRRGHKGSGMTIIDRLRIHPGGKEELLKKFKKRLGVGGTVKMGMLELQGDHRDFVEGELVSSGYKVRRIGG